MLRAAGAAAGLRRRRRLYLRSALLRDSVLSNSALSQFNQQDAVAPGSYQIDLYLNGQFLERDQIRFVRAGKQVLPCFDRPQLTRFGLKIRRRPPKQNACCPVGISRTLR